MWSLPQIVSSNLCYTFISLARGHLYCSSCSSGRLDWKTAKDNHRISLSTSNGGRQQKSKGVEQKENFRIRGWVWYICISFTVLPSKCNSLETKRIFCPCLFSQVLVFWYLVHRKNVDQNQVKLQKMWISRRHHNQQFYFCVNGVHSILRRDRIYIRHFDRSSLS